MFERLLYENKEISSRRPRLKGTYHWQWMILSAVDQQHEVFTIKSSSKVISMSIPSSSMTYYKNVAMDVAHGSDVKLQQTSPRLCT